MRIYSLLCILFVCLYACENDLSEIGQTLIPNEGYIEVQGFKITETSTVRLDSFPTSGVSSLLMGKIKENTTGTTTATPYFHLVRTGYDTRLNYEQNFIYDSLTLHFTTNKIVAGDTAQYQTYYLYRLKELPLYDYLNPFFYNKDSIERESEPVSTLRVYPQKESLSIAYFKLKDDLGKELFNLMLRKDTIFEDGLKFLRYVKGFTIVPDASNNTLISFDPSAGSLYLRCHYHRGEVNYYFDITSVGPGYYSFTNYKNETTNELAQVTQKDSLLYNKGGIGVLQGLNGYMLKMHLPFVEDVDSYKTIVKAEIEIKPKYYRNSYIPMASRLGVFLSDQHSALLGIPTDYNGNSVYGYYYQNSNNVDDRKYTIDITDYYTNMVTSPAVIDKNIYFLVGLPGTLYRLEDNIRLMQGEVSTSFDRMELDEVPVLRIYYIKYR